MDNEEVQRKWELKDAIKFSSCDKLISRGVAGSSSRKYEIEGIAHLTPDKVNCKKYDSEDIVGISVNGMRRGRLRFDQIEVKRAIRMNVTFVIDNEYNRNRKYNVGERELVDFLTHFDYVQFFEDRNSSMWRPK